jgi:hypothetical protein
MWARVERYLIIEEEVDVEVELARTDIYAQGSNLYQLGCWRVGKPPSLQLLPGAYP